MMGSERHRNRSAVPITVGVRFSVDAHIAPRDETIHDALRSLQGLEIEAPEPEVAELYAAVLVDALERAGN